MLLGQLARYGLVGVLNTVIGFALIVFFSRVLKTGEFVANLTGYLAGFTLSYVLNRRWTFASASAHKSSFACFSATCGVAYLCNLGVLFVALHVLKFEASVAQGLAVLTYAGLVFIGSRLFCFPQPSISKSSHFERDSNR
ncbi:MAG: family 2 glycosyl transferase [Hyphomicrobiales bacterium]|nr:family 2 glycosyl transferase [Hyphomicrobiales bacterium]